MHEEVRVQPIGPQCDTCGHPAVLHVLTVETENRNAENYFCEAHSWKVIDLYGPESQRMGPGERETLGQLSRFDIESVVSEKNQCFAVHLRERGGIRNFRIELGHSEATALYWNLKADVLARPMTHKAFANTIEALGATLQQVTIESFSAETKIITALLHVQQNNKEEKVDVRPSDALCLAIVCNAPVFVSEKFLAEYRSGHEA
jgi:bifunctional DNase/RNase